MFVRSARRAGGGYSLIEVLVALLVLSLGLLGLATLQATGLRWNHQSYERTQAALLTYDIIDRMRANRTSTVYNDVDLTNAYTTSVDCSATLTPDQMAQCDIQQWIATINALLADGRGAICRGDFDASLNCSPNPGATTYKVAVTWFEQELSTAQRLIVEAQL